MQAPSGVPPPVSGAANKPKTWSDLRKDGGGVSGKVPFDQSAASLEDDFNYGVHVASCSVDVRMKFLRKVYGIVGAQLLLTTLMAALFRIEAVTYFVQNFPTGLYLSMFMALGTLFGLFVKRHDYPANMYLLTAFTVAEAYLVATIVTFYEFHSVLQAAMITTSVVAGLTLFAFQTKYDFTVLNSLLGTTLFMFVGIGFVMALMPPSEAVEMVYAVGGAALFSLFLVVDTQRLLYRVSTDEYILCAIDLYLDILNLFLRILEIMGSRK